MNLLGWFRPERHPLLRQFASVEPPPGSAISRDCRFIVLDLELTGLDPRRDHIVSLGWVPIRGREIVLDEARHYLVKSPISVGQSAVIHGLHDRHLATARSLPEVLEEFLRSFAGYVPVAHHASLDRVALDRAIRQWLGRGLQLKFVDTMQIEHARLTRRNTEIAPTALRLDHCLARHRLPALAQHHALEDAYACALLLLSQISSAGGGEMTLAELRRASR